jgi:predicted nucleotidyltransferase
MLAELFSSKTRAEFFRILFGINPEEFHLREIERQSGLTIGTIKKEAEKLVGLSLIIKRVDGNRTYYQANMAHPIYKTIRELVLKTSGIRSVIEKAFKDQDVDFVFLFGSVVSGNLKPESDIDLFVIGNLGLRKVCQIMQEPAEDIGRELNPHVMKLGEFSKRKKANEHFVTRVLESPILMIIGKEYELKKLG